MGTAEAITPLLAEPIEGHVYLARPLCGGAGQAACTEQDALDGHLYQLYLELGGEGELANAGVNIKVPGFVEANPATGQLTTKFPDNPQAPFSELQVDLNGGPRAPLDNPAACGPASTTADFTPWSAPGITPEGLLMPGTPDATPSSFYDVEGCADPPALQPGLLGGHGHAAGGQVQRVHARPLPQRPRTVHQGHPGAHAAGPAGNAFERPAVRRTGRERGHCTANASKIGTTQGRLRRRARIRSKSKATST